jgi:hypothetical protein
MSRGSGFAAGWIKNCILRSFVICAFSRHYYNIATCIFIARQQFGKQIFAGANTRNNMTSVAKQRFSKHAYLTTEAVLSAWPVHNGYKEVFCSIE